MTASEGGRLAPFGSVADFTRVADPAVFSPVPPGWFVGVTDVVRSTAAIAEGRAKATAPSARHFARSTPSRQDTAPRSRTF